MDLHDFDDVAVNYDRYLEVISNNNYDFINFYTELAEKYGQDGIIDIACGTGALLIPFLQKGFDVCGLDLSKAMLNEAKKKINELDIASKTNLFCANMTDFCIDRKFSLAVIARSGFMHLLTKKEQRDCLLNIKKHLLPGGVLTLNTFDPVIDLLYEQMNNTKDNYALRLEYVNADGFKEKIYNAITYDPASQVMDGMWRFETLSDCKVISTRERPVKMRFTFRSEMEYLFELCGFEILNVYGGFDKSEPVYPSGLIWILR